ncbi:MAG: hypothetical protein L6R41_001636 [Letrouitia leprolyta]|nr:MAG: hypothetical protein L6R41_001636 [Letrouitia leprolyta]
MKLLGSKKQQPAMAPLPKWKPPRTLIDIYLERDQTQWYWRLLAMISYISHIVSQQSTRMEHFKGFRPRRGRTSHDRLRLVSNSRARLQELGIPNGHYLRLDRLLRSHAHYSPCLFSSFLGLVNIAIALSTRHGNQSVLNLSSVAALVLSIFSTTTYLTLSLLTFRKIHVVRARDAMHRHRSDSDSYHLLPEDEMQRQQLLRLLERRTTSNNKTHKPNSAEASQSTFRIDLPESLRRMETRLTAPRNVYEGRNERNNSFNDRSRNFSPLSQFASTRWTSSSYEPVAQENSQPSLLPQTPPFQQSERLIPERNFSQSSQAPPYSPGEVEAPIEKRGEIADLTGEVHPLEREERARPQYRVVDAPPDGRLLSPDPGLRKVGRGADGKENRDVRRQRSTSRESRRAEIELERDLHGDAGKRAELEGVRVSPRIMRVQTDGS